MCKLAKIRLQNPRQTDDEFIIVFDFKSCIDAQLNHSSLYQHLVAITATHPMRPEWIVDGFNPSIIAEMNPISQQMFLKVTLYKLGQGSNMKNAARD